MEDSQPKRANRPTTLGKLPAFSFPPLQDHTKTLPTAAPETCPEEVPEEQIIYIDDDTDPVPLQLLERQVDSLLMPPPLDTTPMAQKAPKAEIISSPGCLKEEDAPPALLGRRSYKKDEI